LNWGEKIKKVFLYRWLVFLFFNKYK
jgi:hypothetical protein